MRILYVSHTHPPEGAILENVGGMQRVSAQLVRELKRNPDVKVEPLTINVSTKGAIGLQTFGFLLSLLVRLPAKARKAEADIIVFSSMVTASLSRFLRGRLSVPMVAINHGRDVTLPVALYQRFVPQIFKSLDGVISVSNATRDECIARGMDPEKGVALPNGFDFTGIKERPSKEQSRIGLQKEFGIPLEGNKMLLTVGRMVKRKGHEWFIREVIPRLKSETVYVMVGDGPEQEGIERAINNSYYKSQIFMLGRLNDELLHQAYAASDLFVMPNIPVQGDMEGFGIVLLEANIAETPAVAADLEGIKDVISNGENGYRIKALCPELFAQKIDEVLSKSLETLSIRARRFVEERFSWHKVAQQYVGYFNEVIERSNGQVH